MISGEFEVLRDKYQEVDLEIFYHPNHAFNIDRMMAGMKASLAYCSKNFSPYPYKNVRIVEATVVGYPGNGTATSQPTIFTWQENGGFISNLEGDESLDVVFNTTTHEMAHQWFGHILRPAQTEGVAVLCGVSCTVCPVDVSGGSLWEKDHDGVPEIRNGQLFIQS